MWYKVALAKESVMLSIGLMSGTSMDGIDGSLMETDGNTMIYELGHASTAYAEEFKILLHATQFCIKQYQGQLTLAKQNYADLGIKAYLEQELGLSSIASNNTLTRLKNYSIHTMKSALTLDTVITHSTKLHAELVQILLEKYNSQQREIDVIGYHGQAMYHQPNQGLSLILGDGQLLADQLQLPVITDFRSRDLAAGGQGAPFAPIYHQALAARDGLLPAVVVNCGGIANLTLMINQNPEDLIGFDTGPGNGLIDRLVRLRTNGLEQIDEDGRYGMHGKVHQAMLDKLRRQSIIKEGSIYFDLIPPKSLDFGDLTLIEELNKLSLEDACATLEAFTAATIVDSLNLLDDKTIPSTWILAGGGWKNPVLKRELTQRLKQKLGSQIKVKEATYFGWNNQSLEAQIFAYFAVRSLQGKPLSVPGTTNVSKPTTGGRIFLPTTGCSTAVASLLKLPAAAFLSND